MFGYWIKVSKNRHKHRIKMFSLASLKDNKYNDTDIWKISCERSVLREPRTRRECQWRRYITTHNGWLFGCDVGEGSCAKIRSLAELLASRPNCRVRSRDVTRNPLAPRSAPFKFNTINYSEPFPPVRTSTAPLVDQELWRHGRAASGSGAIYAVIRTISETRRWVLFEIKAYRN